MSAFGDDTLLIEKFVQQARHIEFQVGGGGVWWSGGARVWVWRVACKPCPCLRLLCGAVPGAVRAREWANAGLCCAPPLPVA
jgi:hypothetical protein